LKLKKDVGQYPATAGSGYARYTVAAAIPIANTVALQKRA